MLFLLLLRHPMTFLRGKKFLLGTHIAFGSSEGGFISPPHHPHPLGLYFLKGCSLQSRHTAKGFFVRLVCNAYRMRFSEMQSSGADLQSVLHRNFSQDSQPIGGFKACPLSRAPQQPIKIQHTNITKRCLLHNLSSMVIFSAECETELNFKRLLCTHHLPRTSCMADQLRALLTYIAFPFLTLELQILLSFLGRRGTSEFRIHRRECSLAELMQSRSGHVKRSRILSKKGANHKHDEQDTPQWFYLAHTSPQLEENCCKPSHHTHSSIPTGSCHGE